MAPSRAQNFAKLFRNVPCLLGPRAGSTTHRYSATTSTPKASHNVSLAESLPAKWLTDLKQRIGYCISFGLEEKQVDEVGNISRILAQEWRELLAGSEGYLTGKGRAGIEGREVAWGEMDVMPRTPINLTLLNQGHVNNVTYIRYAESARVNWIQNYAKYQDPAHKKEWSELCTSKSTGLILRSMKTDYKFPMTYPDTTSIYHKLRCPPASSTDSFTLDVLILSGRHQRPAARCVEDIVIYDYKRGRKAPLPSFMVDKFQKTWRLQEAARERNEGRVRELLGRVERLERGSWRREGAREDMGNV